MEASEAGSDMLFCTTRKMDILGFECVNWETAGKLISKKELDCFLRSSICIINSIPWILPTLFQVIMIEKRKKKIEPRTLNCNTGYFIPIIRYSKFGI